jgi:hypothetical protein
VKKNNSRPPLTIEEHRRANELLTGIDRQISELCDLIGGRKGVKVRIIDRIIHADRVLRMDVRGQLEDVLFRDHPKDPRANTDLYYPREEKRA